MTTGYARFLGNAMRFMVLAVLVLLVGNKPAFSQDGIGQLGIAFSAGLPKGDFEQNLDDNGYGINANLVFRLGNSPLSMGLEGQFLQYSSETRNVPFSVAIPDVRVDVETSNNIVQSHLLLRAQNREGAVQPYAEGLLGFSYLFTETTIRDEDDIDDEEIASTTNFDDFTSSYGFGGGVMIRLHEMHSNLVDGASGHPATILLDMRVRYLRGGQAEYLKRGDLRRDNGEVSLHPTRSETDLMTINVGVVFSF